MPFYKVTLGAFELIALQAQPDRIIQASQLFPTVDPSEFEREFARNSHYFGKDATELRFTQNVCAIRASDQLILVDTGIPVENDGALVIPSLKEAGISPEDITLVMLTHRDMDHVGGNLTNGKPTFPNARYVIGQSEYESYKVDPVRATFPAHITPLEDSGVLDVVADDAEVARGIRLMLTPGHRSGATSVLVGDKAILTADVWHHPAQVGNPAWHIGFDSDAEQAATTRAKVIEQVEEHSWLAAVPHTTEFGLGRVATKDGERVWLPEI
jgi:glyoxylase-like metal-dependent hydrolase (beta-lactamase superfamily II)